MKKIIYSAIFCAFASFSSGQIAIGKENIKGTSTLLDFNDSAGNSRGIILSAVDNTTNVLATDNINNNGTFLLDKSDKKLKMFENNTWIELSDSGNTDNLIPNSSSELGTGVIIGAAFTNAKGILVLESSEKALILPKINNPHTTVKSPYAGMMCYDTASKTLAIFNGSVWNYWK